MPSGVEGVHYPQASHSRSCSLPEQNSPVRSEKLHRHPGHSTEVEGVDKTERNGTADGQPFGEGYGCQVSMCRYSVAIAADTFRQEELDGGVI